MNRLWNNPPTTADGMLNYAALTLGEVRADLTETLSDLVLNGGQNALQPLLDAIEDDALIEALGRATAAPTPRLVTIMTQSAMSEALPSAVCFEGCSRGGPRQRPLSQLA